MNARTLIRPVLGQAEHISIEAAPEDIAPVPTKKGRVTATYTLTSKFRGLHYSLALLDNHQLQIDQQRRGEANRRCVVDLRFVNAQPTRTRRIAWLWAADTLLLLLLAGAKFGRVFSGGSDVDLAMTLAIAGGASLAAACTAFWCVRSTTESLSFFSPHGAVPLIKITGGIGSAQAGKKFFVALIRSITETKTPPPANLHQYLRDEMREHHRLHELGALSDAQYERGKANILKSF